MPASSYAEWRQRWPSLIVERRTEEAAELLQRYYATTSTGVPAYSGFTVRGNGRAEHGPVLDWHG
jgi:hypothetical protein